jgi:hypothetical protein
LKMELNDEEIRALYLVMDLALKAGGLGALQAVQILNSKIPRDELEEIEEEKFIKKPNTQG